MALARRTVFETATFSHSATSPAREIREFEAPDGAGGWRLVAMRYPRAQADEHLVDSLFTGELRRVFVGAHRVRSLARLRYSLELPEARELAPVAARHSRLGEVRASLDSLGGAATRRADLPLAWALHRLRPNPAAGTAMVAFDAPQAARVQIEAFDLQGRRVATVLDRSVPPGWHAFAWSLADPRGMRLAAGVYYLRLRAGAFRARQSLVIGP